MGRSRSRSRSRSADRNKDAPRGIYDVERFCFNYRGSNSVTQFFVYHTMADSERKSRSRSWSLDSLGRRRRKSRTSPPASRKPRSRSPETGGGYSGRSRDRAYDKRDKRDDRRGVVRDDRRDVRRDDRRDERREERRDYRRDDRRDRYSDRRDRDRIEAAPSGEGKGAQAFRSRILNEGVTDNAEGDEEQNGVALDDMDEAEQIKKLLGFASFDTTKGKKIDENDKTAAIGAVRKTSKREYRQYMNRRGGFNRPLAKMN